MGETRGSSSGAAGMGGWMEADTDEVSTGGLVGVAGIIGEAGVGKGDTIHGGEMSGGEMGGGEVGVGIGGFDGEFGIAGVSDEGGGNPEDGCSGREMGGRGIWDCVGDLGNRSRTTSQESRLLEESRYSQKQQIHYGDTTRNLEQTRHSGSTFSHPSSAFFAFLVIPLPTIVLTNPHEIRS
ncbi:uncharacterized protein LACBIDRAFT_336022 [Laccaria bicolor S238N-H82]|uniref:Predicted protein n=1 Tax=Laccaria bicolor (strain S238N-H82 / ATCC MYA-4686) TaxID=486041 RepID=B0E2B3_LACBS|nr:uncharacterized protein LACBIDRAFT_296035 [Laccaria bicolor S238N-H82]XP_001890986.1 uncharacterized protein LACBIDRAFT_336022 [Laccaria bicolor S238N-H82]EDQ98365.1 predicted protein [Laccaria bicolor S238N-H82]EDQ99027.1 predicted protein [Laccaria bicolor S238N-H82]|eukprot:XP_001890335.1 predicted protein [Laccaria bicolor S238N-H82]